MNNFHFGYSRHALNKKITGDLSLGWQAKQGTVDDLASHVKLGLPVCHSTFTGQKRADANFESAEIVLVDIDNSTILKGADGKPVKGEDGKAIKVYREELTIPQALDHPFIKDHCIYSYTSASHKPDHHKYRLAFRLPNRITDPKLFKAVLIELKTLIPAIDRAAISVTNIYFGNDKAIDLINNPDALPIAQEFIDKAIASHEALEAEKQALKANREIWKANYSDCDNDRLEREIYRALEYIPPRIEGGGTYDTSIRVCWALAHHFGESKAIAIMESHSPSHGAWDVAKVVSQAHKYPDVGIGSLFHFAKCNGYKREELTKEEKKAWWDAQPKDGNPFFATLTFNTWLKVAKRQNVHIDTVVTFLYKDINKSDYQNVTTDFSPAQISAAFWEWVQVTNIPIKWCVGAKKACCLLSHGYVAIAFSGVSNGYRTPKDALGNKIGKSYLVEDVAKFVNGDRPHVICFDSDTKTKTVQGINANIKAFGGLLNAKAKEVSKSKHDVDLVRVLTWQPESGKGVDDLIVANGIETFEAIDKTAKSYNGWKLATERKLTYSVSLAVCRRYLGEVNIPKMARLIVIKSAMDTGKTYSIAEAIEDKIGDPNHVIFVITHKDNLAVELGNRFKIVHRKDISSSGEGKLFGYVMCADSAHSKANPSFNPDDYAGKTITVIIDECESVAWHILSSNTDIKKNRVEVLENLSKLSAMALSGNGQLFLADAHVSDRSVNFFHQLACQSKPELIELEPFVIANSFKFTETPWRVNPFSSKVPSFWKKELDTYLEQKPDAKVLIQVESQKVHSKWSTQTIEKDLKAKFSGKRIVRVDSDTVKNPDHPAYMAHQNFTDFCKKWDIVICSNVLESGVSIDLYGHFSSVWACIWGVSSPRQANQMLARLRDPVDRYVWIAQRAINHVGNGSENAYALLKPTDNQTKATIQALQQNGLGDLETEDGCLSLGLKTWASYGAEINHDGRNLVASILGNIKADGHFVGDVITDKDKDTDIAMEVVRDENYNQYAETIENQSLIEDKTAELIEKKIQGKIKIQGVIQPATEPEKQQLRKYNLQKTYGESNAETIKKDDKQWYSQLNLHYLLTVGSAFLMSKDVANTKALEHNGKGYALDILKSTYWRKIRVLEESGILDLIPANGEKLELYQGCDRLAKFTQNVKKWRYEIKNIFGITLKPEWFGEKATYQEHTDFQHEDSHNHDRDSEDTKDVLIAKAMLKLLGAKLMPVSKKGQRGKQVRCYEVVRDYKSFSENKKRVYYNIVPWGGDNRYQVFDHWLKRDTEYQEKQNVHTDTVVTFLYKDINKSDYQDVTTEKVADPITPNTPNTPNPSPKPNSNPNTPPKNESLYDRIKRLNEPLSEFCQSQYTARYA